MNFQNIKAKGFKPVAQEDQSKSNGGPVFSFAPRSSMFGGARNSFSQEGEKEPR